MAKGRQRGRHYSAFAKFNLILFKPRVLLILLSLIIFLFKFEGIWAYFTDTKTATNMFSIVATFDISFNPNGGDGLVESQTVSYNFLTALRANTYTNEGFEFNGWNTMPDGSGTAFQDEQLVTHLDFENTENVVLYAQWNPISSNAVALVNGRYYNTLQAAINAVPTDDTETVVKLLKDIKENVSVAQNQNITFNLGNHTIQNKTAISVIRNSGTVRISNGTIEQTIPNESAFDNSSTGKLYMSGGSIMMTHNSGKQAIYNNGGIVEISGDAYLSTVGSQTNEDKKRATVHNLNGGRLTILGGTIVSKYYIAVKNDAGTLIIGVKDGSSDNTTPVIQGGTYGVSSTPGYSYYDGILKGKTAAVNNESLISDKEDLPIVHLTEIIDGETFHDIILSNQYRTVTFNPNGGNVTEPIRGVRVGEAIGTLPIPTQTGYRFDGWFTDPDSGTQINENTIINEDITFYAHWTYSYCFDINGTRYATLQEAVQAVPKNNEQTTITMIRNVDSTQKTTIAVNQNIVLDLGPFTINHTGADPFIENKGTLSMVSGTVMSSASQGIINNNTGASFTMSDGNLIATGDRQAVYNYGTVLITGNAYLSSRTSGTPSATTMSRGTVQNLAGGTITITGGIIVGEVQQAISNEGTLTIGVQDGSINTTLPMIKGKTYGIVSTGTINFYDGTIKGKDGTFQGNVNQIEPNSNRILSNEIIDGVIYITEYLEF